MPLAKIFYASLTGNTEEIADIVAESLEDLDFDVEIEECSNVSASDFEDADLCIVATYTYGDGDLPDELTGNELGKFKLEYIFKEVVMLGPKLYMGITTDNKIISKVKGYKNAKEIDFTDFKNLLDKNNISLDLKHDKWFKDLSQSSITIKSQIYKLMITENKRRMIYKEIFHT